jgi:protein-tyrosine phosphatase
VIDKSVQTQESWRTIRTFGSFWAGRFVSGVKRSAKRLLPRAVLQEAQNFCAYQPKERRIYLKLRLFNSLGLTRPKRSRIPATARSIVFVCFGNIIRSPGCEALMKQALAGRTDLRIHVTSAGLNATPGRSSHPWAIAAARDFGVSLEQHRARLLTADLVARADVIFAMDYQNQVQLLSRWKDSRRKVFMLSAYADADYGSVEISDPYYLGSEETRRCYHVLNACVRNIVSSLCSERANDGQQKTEDEFLENSE